MNEMDRSEKWKNYRFFFNELNITKMNIFKLFELT